MNVSCQNHRGAFMRRFVITSLFVLAVTNPLAAQGWILPRCGDVVRPVILPDGPRPTPPIVQPRACGQSIERTRSDVHVELADRVLRYEVEERFVNRGGTLGEADYIFPLPNGAAFQDLKLSID